jgi:hypothetical protein
MAATSTNLDLRYILSAYLPTVTVYDEDNINQNPQINVFASSMVKALDAMSIYGQYTYRNEHIPVIARRKQNNTSCWWMIMAANGLNHPLVIEPGTILNLPNIDAVRASTQVKDNSSARVPTFVTI